MRLVPVSFATSLVLLLACAGGPHVRGPGMVVPLTIGEGTGDGKKSAPAGSAAPAAAASASSGSPAPAANAVPASSAEPAPATAPPSSAATTSAPAPAALTDLPDPEALRTVDQIEYAFVWESGVVGVESVRRRRFERPVVSARKMGRYAVELSVGHELIDRVRFDFPMLATDEPVEAGARRSLKEPPPLTRGPLRQKLLVPFSERARRVVLVDRATGKELELVWPPVDTPPPSAPAKPAPKGAPAKAAPSAPAKSAAPSAAAAPSAP